ncbi:MAG: CvpA family protein [Ginsengibacter sp.]
MVRPLRLSLKKYYLQKTDDYPGSRYFKTNDTNYFVMVIDIAFFFTLVLAVFNGLRKGFVVGIFSLLAFIIGLAAALKFSSVVALYLGENVATASRWLPALSFFLVFIGVIILVGLGAKFIRKMIDLAMLGWLDRLGGMVLYVLIYTIIFSVMLFFTEKLSILKPGVITGSVIYKYVVPWGPKVINNLGNIIPFFKGMFIELEGFFESMAKKSV